MTLYEKFNAAGSFALTPSVPSVFVCLCKQRDVNENRIQEAYDFES